MGGVKKKKIYIGSSMVCVYILLLLVASVYTSWKTRENFQICPLLRLTVEEKKVKDEILTYTSQMNIDIKNYCFQPRRIRREIAHNSPEEKENKLKRLRTKRKNTKKNQSKAPEKKKKGKRKESITKEKEQTFRREIEHNTLQDKASTEKRMWTKRKYTKKNQSKEELKKKKGNIKNSITKEKEHRIRREIEHITPEEKRLRTNIDYTKKNQSEALEMGNQTRKKKKHRNIIEEKKVKDEILTYTSEMNVDTRNCLQQRRIRREIKHTRLEEHNERMKLNWQRLRDKVERLIRSQRMRMKEKRLKQKQKTESSDESNKIKGDEKEVFSQANEAKKKYWEHLKRGNTEMFKNHGELLKEHRKMKDKFQQFWEKIKQAWEKRIQEKKTEQQKENDIEKGKQRQSDKIVSEHSEKMKAYWKNLKEEGKTHDTKKQSQKLKKYWEKAKLDDKTEKFKKISVKLKEYWKKVSEIIRKVRNRRKKNETNPSVEDNSAKNIKPSRKQSKNNTYMRETETIKGGNKNDDGIIKESFSGQQVERRTDEIEEYDKKNKEYYLNRQKADDITKGIQEVNENNEKYLKPKKDQRTRDGIEDHKLNKESSSRHQDIRTNQRFEEYPKIFNKSKKLNRKNLQNEFKVGEETINQEQKIKYVIQEDNENNKVYLERHQDKTTTQGIKTGVKKNWNNEKYEQMQDFWKKVKEKRIIDQKRTQKTEITTHGIITDNAKNKKNLQKVNESKVIEETMNKEQKRTNLIQKDSEKNKGRHEVERTIQGIETGVKKINKKNKNWNNMKYEQMRDYWKRVKEKRIRSKHKKKTRKVERPTEGIITNNAQNEEDLKRQKDERKTNEIDDDDDDRKKRNITINKIKKRNQMKYGHMRAFWKRVTGMNDGKNKTPKFFLNEERFLKEHSQKIKEIKQGKLTEQKIEVTTDGINVQDGIFKETLEKQEDDRAKDGLYEESKQIKGNLSRQDLEVELDGIKVLNENNKENLGKQKNENETDRMEKQNVKENLSKQEVGFQRRTNRKLDRVRKAKKYQQMRNYWNKVRGMKIDSKNESGLKERREDNFNDREVKPDKIKLQREAGLGRVNSMFYKIRENIEERLTKQKVETTNRLKKHNMEYLEGNLGKQKLEKMKEYIEQNRAEKVDHTNIEKDDDEKQNVEYTRSEEDIRNELRRNQERIYEEKRNQAIQDDIDRRNMIRQVQQRASNNQRKNKWLRNAVKQYRQDAKEASKFGQIKKIGPYPNNKQRRYGGYRQQGIDGNLASQMRQVGRQAARFKEMDEKLNELWKEDDVQRTTDRFGHMGDIMKQYWNMEEDQQKTDKYKDMNQKLKDYLKEMDK